MKINWGVKITILYVGFVLLILTLVSMSMRQNVDLVSNDYYEQELKFQDRINKINVTNQLEEPLIWEVKKGKLNLNFPQNFEGKQITGSIYFFRPSDETKDKTIEINTDNTSLSIPTKDLQPGLFKIHINWNVDEVEYYNEGLIKIF